MKLKIFPLSTRHILSFKIYQTIRIIFILLQKTSKRQYHLFVCWFKATERKEQHCNLFDKNSLSISRRFSKTLTTLTKGWRLLQTWLLNSLVFLRHAQKENVDNVALNFSFEKYCSYRETNQFLLKVIIGNMDVRRLLFMPLSKLQTSIF